MKSIPIRDAHRHIGALPAYPFYGCAPVQPATSQVGSVAQLFARLDSEGTESAVVLPNYGVPDPLIAFSFNELCLDATSQNDRVLAALWVSPLPEDQALTRDALKLSSEPGVVALKLSFLLGGRPSDPRCKPLLDEIFANAEQNNLVVHVHTSPGGASDVDEVSNLVEWYGDRVAIHLVHLGGGMSGHIKLIGGRFFDWISNGKRVYTDASWAIGFAPTWLAQEIEKRGIGHDRILFASDEPWGDRASEIAKMAAAVGDGELGQLIFNKNFNSLYLKES